MCSNAEKRARGGCVRLGGLILAAALATAGGVHAQAPQLLEQHKCYFCHAERDAKTGPAFVEIAAAYKDNAKAVEVLTAVIRKGSHGSGPWHMPPHPEVTEAEARAMARYILSLKQ